MDKGPSHNQNESDLPLRVRAHIRGALKDPVISKYRGVLVRVALDVAKGRSVPPIDDMIEAVSEKVASLLLKSEEFAANPGLEYGKLMRAQRNDMRASDGSLRGDIGSHLEPRSKRRSRHTKG